MTETDASLYEKPFEHVAKHVRPVRQTNRRAARARYWWRFGEARPGLREKLAGHERFIVTSEKSKHRFFAWLPINVAPDHRLIVFPRSDDVFFGILSSQFHVSWVLSTGSTLEDRPAYATSTCFNPFPFPEGLTPDRQPGDYDNVATEDIVVAAKKLVKLRDNWLNPQEWVERVPEVVPGYPARIIPKKGHEADLKKRTLTNLYNERPAWLDNAHRQLDEAVAAAYDWSPDLRDDEILANLLELNLSRATA